MAQWILVLAGISVTTKLNSSDRLDFLKLHYQGLSLSYIRAIENVLIALPSAYTWPMKDIGSWEY